MKKYTLTIGYKDGREDILQVDSFEYDATKITYQVKDKVTCMDKQEAGIRSWSLRLNGLGL